MNWLERDVLQPLHEKAHPDGPLYTENCREQECRAAREILDGS